MAPKDHLKMVLLSIHDVLWDWKGQHWCLIGWPRCRIGSTHWSRGGNIKFLRVLVNGWSLMNFSPSVPWHNCLRQCKVVRIPICSSEIERSDLSLTPRVGLCAIEPRSSPEAWCYVTITCRSSRSMQYEFYVVALERELSSSPSLQAAPAKRTAGDT